jgi:hypothetical protein
LLIANHFCKYFSGIESNLADKTPFPTECHQSYLHGNYTNCIFFESVSEEEIISIVGFLCTGALPQVIAIFVIGQLKIQLI